MTTLVVEELRTSATLEQDFTINLKRRFVLEGVRPYIYMHNAPSGTFTLTLKEGAETLDSVDFTSAEIKTDLSTSDNYAHLWKGLLFNYPVYLKDSTYKLELSSSGYTYSDSSYIGWIKEFENQFNDTSYTGSSDLSNPFSFQLFEQKRTNYHD